MEPVTPSPEAAPLPAGEVLVEAEGLSKGFGPVRAVQDVGFQVRRGELVGFLGPNGAGKSTTMRMLTGYLRPDTGAARLAGLDVSDPAARRRLGYLPEHTPLHREMRVDRFLDLAATLHGLAGAARRDAVAQVVDRCDLEGYAHRRIHTLSKGYRQRVGLAQALVHDPDVLVLDEPTSGLDPREIVRIRDLVARLAQDKTVLLSTHVLPEVEEVCRRVLILSGGRLVADGTPEELAAAEGEHLVVEVADGPGGTDLAAALADLDGVREAVDVPPLRGGMARCALVVGSRREAAAEVQDLARSRGWLLLELRHELATLEQIFLSRTRGGPAEEEVA